MFDFPATPSDGELYSPVGGPNYVFRSASGAWEIQPGFVAKTGDTMTGALTLPADPTVALHSATKQYVDQRDARRNRIINGAMQISQENGNTAAATSAYYGADQWVTHSSGTGVYTTQRVQSPTPNGSFHRYRITISTADAAVGATDYLIVNQQFEGTEIQDFRWGSASAKQVILRFGFKGPTGTYSIAIKNGAANNRSYLANFTISAGQANTDTEQTLVILGDTTGSWVVDTTTALSLFVTLMSGTTHTATAGWNAGAFFGVNGMSNGAGTAAAVFELFDVGLYLDLDNTGVAPKWEMPDLNTELLACRRYFQTIYVQGMMQAASTTEVDAFMTFSEMRVAPTVTQVAAVFLTNTISATFGQGALTMSMTTGASSSSMNPRFGSFAGFTAGASYLVRGGTVGQNVLRLSARL